jgi:hypothetical protein
LVIPVAGSHRDQLAHVCGRVIAGILTVVPGTHDYRDATLACVLGGVVYRLTATEKAATLPGAVVDHRRTRAVVADEFEREGGRSRT